MADKLMAEVVLGDRGAVFVNTDTIHRAAENDLGYDDDDFDDDADFDGDYDYDDDADFEGDYDDDDDDPDFGRRNRRDRRGGGRGRGRGRGRGQGRGRGRSGGKGKGKVRNKENTSGWISAPLSGKQTIAEAGPVQIKIVVQHDFKLDDFIFKGTEAGTDLASIYFGTKRIWYTDAGVDVTVFDAQSNLRSKVAGHVIKQGLTITLNFNTTADSGAVKALLLGTAPASQL